MDTHQEYILQAPTQTLEKRKEFAMEFPLAPDERKHISSCKKTLKEFQQQLVKIIKKKVSTADLLQLTLTRSYDSYYYGLTSDDNSWLMKLRTDMSTMQLCNSRFTERYCAHLFVEYSRAIPQLEPVDELAHDLPVLIRTITFMPYRFDRGAIKICTQQYPNLRLYTTPLQRQGLQRLKNDMLKLLTTITNDHILENTVDREIVWFSRFLQNMGIKNT